MDIEELLDIVSEAADGKDDIEKAAVGFQGYGFIFRDPFNSNELFITVKSSGKFCAVGSDREFIKDYLKDKIKSAEQFLSYDTNYDILLAGSLKTLLPSLKFGGDEILFFVWMFVKTPDDQRFPATFYYGPSGAALGGWHSEDYEKKDIFPENFSKLINFSPFDFTEDQLDALVEALECALRKVPVSDFYGVYQHDLGNALMGVQADTPFIFELGYEYDKTDIKFYLEEVAYYKDKLHEYY